MRDVYKEKHIEAINVKSVLCFIPPMDEWDWERHYVAMYGVAMWWYNPSAMSQV